MAAEVLKRRLVRKPESDISRVLLASVYGHMGDLEASRAEWAEVLRINPHYSLEHRRKILPYKNPAEFEQLVDGGRLVIPVGPAHDQALEVHTKRGGAIEVSRVFPVRFVPMTGEAQEAARQRSAD